MICFDYKLDYYFITIHYVKARLGFIHSTSLPLPSTVDFLDALNLLAVYPPSASAQTVLAYDVSKG